MNYVEEIMQWNEDRDNTDYSPELEYNMLGEELDEFYFADTKANAAKELADIIFVAVGSLYKLCEGDKQKVEDICLAVSASNNIKGRFKDATGKITKPKDYVKPEPIIANILESR